ncbi:biosynthetic peptidoglycan transglycosylase [Nocardia tengchongensis]|uniref:biosynthetic peptidoglycan transglycosylase n=1 Tax=Nocardia tengchongensis TaxID=2055889 RepID=UPI0036A84AFC
MVVLVVLGVVAAAAWALTPSVADADQRVRDLAAERHSALLSDSVPARFETALLATEDSRFYRHHGIDILGMVRGGLGLLASQESGGSTLDKQLIKMLYFHGDHPLVGAPEQLLLGVKLDTTYSKSEILRMYADVTYFGHGFYGLQDASCGYFGVPPDRLSWSQATLLAGLPQAPSNYDPLTRPDLAASRQQHVIDRLVATGALTHQLAAEISPAAWHLTTTPGCRD